MSIIPFQKTHNKNSEGTSAKVTKRFFPSVMRNKPPAGAPAAADCIGVIMGLESLTASETAQVCAASFGQARRGCAFEDEIFYAPLRAIFAFAALVPVFIDDVDVRL